MGAKRSFLFYLPDASPFLNLSAVSKAALVVAVSVAALSVLDFYVNLGIMLFAIAVLVLARIPLRNLRVWMYGFVFMLIFITTMYTLLSKIPGSVTYAMFPWGTYITENTLPRALSVAFRIWSMILVTLTFLSTTTDSDIIVAFTRLHVPYTFCFLVSLTLRSVQVFTDDWKTIMDAYWSKGVDVNKGGPVKRLRNYVALIVPLIVITLNKVREIDYAAEARGFRLGMKSRTYIDKFKWTLGDTVVATGSAVGVALSVLLLFHRSLL